ncbi:MAG: UDP-3-O-acyl-N-acetylglucosamine deacetylase [Deltaproteobacteria bacterium]|nr:UDP-3-O-acyl-N-acetylglucosamine deacetylase [Deltaproteobacteria bacterium]
MTTWQQRTIRREIGCTGVGLHTGERIALKLKPADPDSGIRFVRADLDSRPEIPACLECVADTRLATTLAEGGNRISTVEHLLAALRGMGVDNATVDVDGPEVPIMDGSAGPFVALISDAGVREQNCPRNFIIIEKPISVHDGEKSVAIAPSNGFEIKYTIDFDHPLLRRQSLSMSISKRTFQKKICRARTFGFLKEVEYLWNNGLALGGSLENAVVIDDSRILNEGGLRYPDEFVRHKILDFIGDVSLLGLPLLGACTVYKSGHALNHSLIRRLCDSPTHYRVGRLDEIIPGMDRSAPQRLFPLVRPAAA